MELKLADIPGAFHLPRVNWNVVSDWVERRVAETKRTQVWRELVVQWLDQLDQALGQQYRLVIGNTLMLFAPDKYEHSHALLDFAEAGVAEIGRALGDLARESWQGPLVILLFEDADTYGLYTSPFDADGEFFRSGGMCLPDGFTHIALRPYPLDVLQRTALHEIAHACLSHLSLPLWLEEGITQMAEEATIPAWSRFKLDSEEASRLKAYWREHGLSDFWWGTSFLQSGEVQHCSYRLAEILFRLLLSNHREQLPEFARRAAAEDAGDSAAREVFSKGLAEIVAQFLGQGTWDPVPNDCETYHRRGAFYATRKHFDRALADFNKALQLNDRSYEALVNRGSTYYELGDVVASVADSERAIELNPKDFHARNNLAWLLATSMDDELRDGPRALELANKACELSGFSSWFCLETLGAACAEIGDFEEALRWTREAIDSAPPEERDSIRERLKLYKAGLSCRNRQSHQIQIRNQIDPLTR